MKLLCIALLAASFVGCVADAKAQSDRVGIHLFIVSAKTGQAHVDQNVLGPFVGTGAAANKERQRIDRTIEQQGLKVRSSPAVYSKGQCIGVTSSPQSTTFGIFRNPRVDIERFLKSEYARKSGIVLKSAIACFD